MFAPQPGQQLEVGRLHFNPIPASIPPGARVRTTVRIRHLDSPERLGERRLKYAEADPAPEVRPALLDEPATGLRPWRSRPAGLAVLAPWDAALESAGERERARLVCLLPARNAAADVPGWLESVARFADAVIALDDGSSDTTAELLEAAPLVEEVLRNPRRETYTGWDDAANRQRLLDAAIEHGADWVLYLDADERIDADDAAALREFVDRGANPDEAYGFRIFRMVDGGESYDRAGLWAYRLFAPRPGQELPGTRLHLVPVPTTIPRSRWRTTTVRIKHLGGATAELRRRRHGKYAEADPERRFQTDYSNLLEVGPRTRPWQARPPGLPVLADPLGRGPASALDLEALDLAGPLLSAVVISRDDERTIERAVRSVTEQECPFAFEVIVVASGGDRTAAIVRERFPDVLVVALEGPALPGVARNAGLALARGEYVTFPGSHVELLPGSLAARVAAHEAGHVMVAGSTVNGTRTPAGWATYFLDHAGSLPGRPAGEVNGPPARCSYARELLAEVGGFPEDMRAGEDTVVNMELWRRGHLAYRCPQAAFIHHSPCRTVPALASHHFRRGRAYGRIVVAGPQAGVPMPRRSAPLFALSFARSRWRDMNARISAWGTDAEQSRFRRVRPLVLLGLGAAAAGFCREAMAPRRPRAIQASEGPG
jgi:glycosyltransferase involved in cell wall biosynthesis